MLPDLSGPWAKLETRHQDFSHAAAGQLTALQMLEIAEARLGDSSQSDRSNPC